MPNIGSSWASSISWYMMSVILSDCVTSKSFLYPHKETVSSLRSWSACLLPIGSQIHSHPSPVLLCVTQGNCSEVHFPSSFVSRFVGPEIYAIWGLSYIKIVQNYKHRIMHKILMRKKLQQITNFKNVLRMKKKTEQVKNTKLEN